MTVRRLLAEDAAVYKDCRLDGLKCNPEAFGSSYEREEPQELQWFADRLDNSHVLGAFRDDVLLGTAGLMVNSGKRSHIGLLWGMFVREAVRRQGVGRALVAGVVDIARDQVEVVQLAVISENVGARRLYESFGFVEYGLERKALRQGDRYYDEVLMALDFTE
jgi:RimJ/RimL family protein N-acetyltransferase